jgi:hypothetical protein
MNIIQHSILCRPVNSFLISDGEGDFLLLTRPDPMIPLVIQNPFFNFIVEIRLTS